MTGVGGDTGLRIQTLFKFSFMKNQRDDEGSLQVAPHISPLLDDELTLLLVSMLLLGL